MLLVHEGRSAHDINNRTAAARGGVPGETCTGRASLAAACRPTLGRMDNRAEVREFLMTRRARVRPESAGLTAGSNRRVAGLRRSEVAALAGVSVEYYSKVVSGIGGQSAASNAVRLFMLPGVGHCGGGDGPSTFDALGVMDQWRDKGQAPASILASRSVNGVVQRTRPLCPYPQTAVYKGSGSTDDAANFECK